MIILHTLLFLGITLVLILGVIEPVMSSYNAMKSLSKSEQAFIAADSAGYEAVYRLANSFQLPSSPVTISLGSSTATINNTDTSTGKDVSIIGSTGEYMKNLKMGFSLGKGIAFHYGVQSGTGGFNMLNSSTIWGNIFSSGTVTGTGGGNMVYGDIVSSGPSGSVYGIHATGTVYAHNIGSTGATTIIDKNAYYQTLSNTTVSGTKYPGSLDQATTSLPISDAQISEWEGLAINGGVLDCTGGTYTITSNFILGPNKIPCDLSITGNPTVTIRGPLWVTGNITFANTAKIVMSPSLGRLNVAIIADNPSNRLTSSIISVKNTVTFSDSGTPGSFVFLVSQNNSAENGGSVEAISLNNSASPLVAYAAHGLIPLQNTISVKEVTAYKISMANSANVRYDKGLASALFSEGPGGGYDLIDWNEI